MKMSLNETFRKTRQSNAQLADFIEEFRRDIHSNPELSNQEFETTKKIRKVLEEKSIKILDLPLKTGLVAEIGEEGESPLAILRSDIDALPISEETGALFASKNRGVMHACGHDFHMSAVLAATLLLKKNEARLKGRVRVLFQPAEETGLGALSIIDTGVLNEAKVIFGIHNDPTMPIGVLGSKDGALTAGVDRFEIKISAKGAHAAKPHEGNDPIVILGQIISALQTIVSRNISSSGGAVVSLTQVHGGNTWNVIPDFVYIEGTVRTFDQQIRELVEQRFRQIVQGIADAFSANIELIWHALTPSVVNTSQWVDFAFDVAKKEGFEAKRIEPTSIGEDFSFYLQKIEGAFIMVGSGSPYALHHPKFNIDERILFPTAHYLYRLVLESLERLNP
jgi:amidohydrolase